MTDYSDHAEFSAWLRAQIRPTLDTDYPLHTSQLVPDPTEARFVFEGDTVALYALHSDAPPLVVFVQAVHRSGDDVVIDGIDVVGAEHQSYLYANTPVHIRKRG